MFVLDNINENPIAQFTLAVSAAHSFFLYISDGSKKTVGVGFTEGSLRVRNAKNTHYIDFNIISNKQFSAVEIQAAA